MDFDCLVSFKNDNAPLECEFCGEIIGVGDFGILYGKTTPQAILCSEECATESDIKKY
jgi:hypothetical protein